MCVEVDTDVKGGAEGLHAWQSEGPPSAELHSCPREDAVSDRKACALLSLVFWFLLASLLSSLSGSAPVSGHLPGLQSLLSVLDHAAPQKEAVLSSADSTWPGATSGGWELGTLHPDNHRVFWMMIFFLLSRTLMVVHNPHLGCCLWSVLSEDDSSTDG